MAFCFPGFPRCGVGICRFLWMAVSRRNARPAEARGGRLVLSRGAPEPGWRRVLAMIAAVGVPGVPVLAHHGQEFLVVQDAAAPSLWSGTAFGGLEWSRDGSADEISEEPGVMLGLGSGVAVGATVGFTGSENDWQYESVSPFVMWEITPRTSRIRVAVIAGYHFADDSLGESAQAPPRVPVTTVAATKEVAAAAPAPPPPPPDPDPDPPCGPAYGPDAPPCPEAAPAATGRKYRHAGHTTPGPVPPPSPAPAKKSSASTVNSTKAQTGPQAKPAAVSVTDDYDGIHRHDEDHGFARFVVEADVTEKDILVVNLIGLWPEDGPPAWGYAAGIRHSFSHSIAAGLEAIGDFGDANEHELILGGYFSPSHRLSFKVGAGVGLTTASPDFSVRTGVVWRF